MKNVYTRLKNKEVFTEQERLSSVSETFSSALQLQ